MQVLFKIFTQSIVLSFAEIRAAKLRSFLSLLGITIGILCIISVRTAVNSLEKNIQNSINSLGNDVLYIQKWPWIWTDDYPWWKYFNRPMVNQKELNQLHERLEHAEGAAIIYVAGDKTVEFENRSIEKIGMVGCSYDYNKVKELEFVQGRYFTTDESNNGQKVAIIGNSIAEELFAGFNQIDGQTVKLEGRKLKVIGVLKKQGEDMFGNSLDNSILIPYAFTSKFVNMFNFEGDPLIAVVPKQGISADEETYEIRGAMRSIRRLSPVADDNFAINQVSVFSNGITQIFGIVNLAGMVIGIFSIIVGGFGIANIMFVSVKERTNIIGIKKALGAKRIFILLEFLLEAVILCLLGGVAGLLTVVALFELLGFLLTHVAHSNFKFYITGTNIFIGISISVITGILAGFIPAFTASRLRPVDAIRG